MTRRIATIALLGTLLSGCASNPIDEAVNDQARPKSKAMTPLRPEDRARLKGIQDHAPTGKAVTINLPNLVVVSKFHGDAVPMVIEQEQLDADLQKHPEYVRIVNRLNYLHDFTPGGKSKSTFDTAEKGPFTMATARWLGVKAIPVKSVDGQVRYYATDIVRTAFETGSANGKPLKLIQFKPRSRADFINPKDIDWLLNVKDFTTAKL
ncbi:MAG: hypothetical protein JST12_17930 [Armatimonadetes bacterium]|nr:hypothetical protein [Armatimonadota bacterium]